MKAWAYLVVIAIVGVVLYFVYTVFSQGQGSGSISGGSGAGTTVYDVTFPSGAPSSGQSLGSQSGGSGYGGTGTGYANAPQSTGIVQPDAIASSPVASGLAGARRRRTI